MRFLDCYYGVLITQRRKVGRIGGAPIYGIKATELIPIRPAVTKSAIDLSPRSFRGRNSAKIKPDAARDGGAALRVVVPIRRLVEDFTSPKRVCLNSAARDACASTLSSQDPASDIPPNEPSRRSSYAWNHKLAGEGGCGPPSVLARAGGASRWFMGPSSSGPARCLGGVSS